MVGLSDPTSIAVILLFVAIVLGGTAFARWDEGKHAERWATYRDGNEEEE